MLGSLSLAAQSAWVSESLRHEHQRHSGGAYFETGSGGMARRYRALLILTRFALA